MKHNKPIQPTPKDGAADGQRWARGMKMKLIVIRNYISEIPASLAKSALEGSGINVMIRKDDCGGMRPYLQAATGVQLLVREDDATRAEEILRMFEEVTD